MTFDCLNICINFPKFNNILNFSIQICVNTYFSNNQKQFKAIFIDTEGSFVTSRVMQMAEEAMKKNSLSSKVFNFMIFLKIVHCTMHACR